MRVLTDALHFGDFAGLVSKTVWFTFGLITTGLAVSGVIVFWKRSARRAGAQDKSAGRRVLSILKPWGGAMGVLKPLNIAILVFAIAASVMTLRFYSASTDERAANYAVQEIGPWRLGALMIAGLGDTSDPVRPGARAMVLARFCPDCWKDIKRLWVNVGAQSAGAGGQRVIGQPGFASTNVRLPDKMDSETRLWMVAEGWDGRLHQVSWRLVQERANQ